MGSRGPPKGPGGAQGSEAPGFYSIFNAEYCLNLFYLKHSSYKFSPIGKSYMGYPHPLRSRVRGGGTKILRVYNIFSSKFCLNLFDFILKHIHLTNVHLQNKEKGQ